MADYHSFRCTDSGYFYGFETELVGGTTIASANFLYAAPFLAGAGGTVNQMFVNPSPTVFARVGYYANLAPNLLYPGTLILDAGCLGTAGTMIWSCAATMSAGQLYWLAFCYPSSAYTVAGHATPDSILGRNLTLSSRNSAVAVSWSATSAFPTTYPTPTSVFVIDWAPGLFVHFSAVNV